MRVGWLNEWVKEAVAYEKQTRITSGSALFLHFIRAPLPFGLNLGHVTFTFLGVQIGMIYIVDGPLYAGLGGAAFLPLIWGMVSIAFATAVVTANATRRFWRSPRTDG